MLPRELSVLTCQCPLEVLDGTDEEVERAVQRMVLGLVEQLKDGPLSPALKVVLPVAAGHIIRDRLAETRRLVSDRLGEIRGGGWA